MWSLARRTLIQDILEHDEVSELARLRELGPVSEFTTLREAISGQAATGPVSNGQKSPYRILDP